MLYSPRAAHLAQRLDALCRSAETTDVDALSRRVIEQCRSAIARELRRLKKVTSRADDGSSPGFRTGLAGSEVIYESRHDAPHLPLAISLREKNPLNVSYLKLVVLFDRVLILNDAAWLSGCISLMEHARIVRAIEGRLYRSLKRLLRRTQNTSSSHDKPIGTTHINQEPE